MRGRAYVGLVAALPLLAGACSSEVGGASGGTMGPLCVARLLVDGREYTGMGGMVREPETTGQEVEASRPGCRDTAGATPPDEVVTAYVLEGIDPATALLLGADVYINEDRLQGARLQERLRYWRSPPTCATAGTFTLRGGWLGFKGPHKPEYDGDIRAPYRLTMQVDTGPSAYTRAQVTVLVTEQTSPSLDQRDVETSLRAGGDVTAEVQCDAGRFVALGVRSSAP